MIFLVNLSINDLPCQSVYHWSSLSICLLLIFLVNLSIIDLIFLDNLSIIDHTCQSVYYWSSLSICLLLVFLVYLSCYWSFLSICLFVDLPCLSVLLLIFLVYLSCYWSFLSICLFVDLSCLSVLLLIFLVNLSIIYLPCHVLLLIFHIYVNYICQVYYYSTFYLCLHFLLLIFVFVFFDPPKMLSRQFALNLLLKVRSIKMTKKYCIFLTRFSGHNFIFSAASKNVIFSCFRVHFSFYIICSKVL